MNHVDIPTNLRLCYFDQMSNINKQTFTKQMFCIDIFNFLQPMCYLIEILIKTVGYVVLLAKIRAKFMIVESYISSRLPTETIVFI